MALGREPEFLQGFAIELVNNRLRFPHETKKSGPIQIIPIHMAVVFHVIGQLIKPVAAVIDIGLELVGIWRAPALMAAIRSAKTCKWAQPRCALMVDDVIGIAAGIARRAIGTCHAGKAKPSTQIKQYGLEGPDIALRLNYRLANGVGWPISFGDRPVQHGDAVPALQIGCVGQNEIGVLHHLGIIRITIDDPRDHIFPVSAFGGEGLECVRHIHGRVPAHVGHIHEKNINAVGIALGRIVDNHVHHAVGGYGRIPGIGLVNALGHAFGIHQQIIGAGDKSQGWTGQRRIGLHLPHLARGFHTGRNGFWKWRLVTEAPRHIDGAQNDLQEMNGAAGLKAIGMGGNSPHGMHGNRAANHLLMSASSVIRPWDIKLNLLFEGNFSNFSGNAFDRGSRNATFCSHGVRRIFWRQKTLGNQRKTRHNLAAIGQRKPAHQFWQRIARCGGHGCMGVGIPNEGSAGSRSCKQAIIGTTGIFNDQPWRVGVTQQVFAIDFLCRQQFMDKGAHKQAIGSGLHAHPFIGNSRVTRLYRID